LLVFGSINAKFGTFGWSSPEVAERASRLALYDALSHEAMGALTTGVFLVGFAVALGASNFAIGVLAAIPFLAQLLQIPAVVLIERWRPRRGVSVWPSAIGRIFLLGSAAAPPAWGVFGGCQRRSPVAGLLSPNHL
jgi:hypothetical protein